MGAQLERGQSFQERYEALFRVSRALCKYRNPKELFRVLADKLRSAVEFNYVAVFLSDETSNKLHISLLETIKGPGFAIPEDFTVEETITWWVYHHQVPVVVSLRDQETRFPRVMEISEKISNS